VKEIIKVIKVSNFIVEDIDLRQLRTFEMIALLFYSNKNRKFAIAKEL